MFNLLTDEIFVFLISHGGTENTESEIKCLFINIFSHFPYLRVLRVLVRDNKKIYEQQNHIFQAA